MPINVPSNPKIYTTKYENFRGVDFTNDPTNVWYRRSPTGTNMLPDAAGRPFKRHGWEIMLSNEELCTALGVDACSILKCAYFELAGKDHIVIFTSAGVIFYNGEVTATCDKPECYEAFDRCFFFEGNGISAFYIYSNFKVWRYSYAPTSVNGFAFEELESEDLTIPTVLEGASADCAGQIAENYNLLGEYAYITYNSIDLKTWWCSDGISIAVPDTFSPTLGTVYHWKYDSTVVSPNSPWVIQSGATAFEDTDITCNGTPEDNYEIYFVYTYGVMLPNNVTNKDKVSVSVSQSLQFDTKLNVMDSSISDADTDCLLHPDGTLNLEHKRAWIEFGKDWSAVNDWGTSGEDFIQVRFPSINVVETTFNDPSDSDLNFVGNATLVVEGV